MNKYKEDIDRAYNYITYGVPIVCFVGAIALIIKSVYDSFNHINATPLLLDVGILVLIGITVSVFFITVKSKTPPRS